MGAVGRELTPNVRTESAVRNMVGAVLGPFTQGAPVTSPPPTPPSPPVQAQAAQTNLIPGRLTWYNPNGGLGFCWTLGPIQNGDLAVALTYVQMNEGGWCGKWICITYKDKMVRAQIKDECPDPICSYGHLDTTQAVWNQLGINTEVGLVTSGVSPGNANLHSISDQSSLEASIRTQVGMGSGAPISTDLETEMSRKEYKNEGVGPVGGWLIWRSGVTK
ncbi:hypothetical protein HDU93_006145 [Gonapodya sp. JEL0774]|nr:hypothetical protein HDU93_006145 [Gonapodya sp. JEL0774]